MTTSWANSEATWRLGIVVLIALAGLGVWLVDHFYDATPAVPRGAINAGLLLDLDAKAGEELLTIHRFSDPTQGSLLVARTLPSGALLWESHHPTLSLGTMSRVRPALMVGKHLLIAARTASDTLFALDPISGKQLWSRELQKHNQRFGESMRVVSSEDGTLALLHTQPLNAETKPPRERNAEHTLVPGHLLALNPANGEVVWTSEVPGDRVYNGTVFTGDHLFLTHRDGTEVRTWKDGTLVTEAKRATSPPIYVDGAWLLIDGGVLVRFDPKQGSFVPFTQGGSPLKIPTSCATVHNSPTVHKGRLLLFCNRTERLYFGTVRALPYQSDVLGWTLNFSDGFAFEANLPYLGYRLDPASAPYREIGRYMPLLLSKGKNRQDRQERLVVLDVEQGKITWRGEPTPGDRLRLAVSAMVQQGDRIVLPLKSTPDRPHWNQLLAIDHNKGTLIGPVEVRLPEGTPPPPPIPKANARAWMLGHQALVGFEQNRVWVVDLDGLGVVYSEPAGASTVPLDKP